jgi:predicted dehydrogenase
MTSVWADPPKGPTIENRLRGGIWCSDIALAGDGIVAYDIHIIDGVTWVMGKRPVSACGRSRTCRADPHGDRSDCSGVVYEYDDGVLWTHTTQSLPNNADVPDLSASFFGLVATGHIQYGGKAYVRGGAKHYSGTIGSIYDQGAMRNIADFHRDITGGHFENPTVHRAVDGTLTAILGREACARRRYLTMEELVKENRKLEIDLRGLKA